MDDRSKQRRYMFTLSIGFAGAVQEEAVVIDVEGLTEEEIEKEVEEQYLEWRNGYLDGHYEEMSR